MPASHRHPNSGPHSRPWCVPWQGTELWPFSLPDDSPTNRATPARSPQISLKEAYPCVPVTPQRLQLHLWPHGLIKTVLCLPGGKTQGPVSNPHSAKLLCSFVFSSLCSRSRIPSQTHDECLMFVEWINNWLILWPRLSQTLETLCHLPSITVSSFISIGHITIDNILLSQSFSFFNYLSIYSIRVGSISANQLMWYTTLENEG